MDSLKYMLRMLLWSAGISVGMKIVFGMYSVLGAVTLFIPFTVGILSAMSLTRSGNTATVILSSIHILLVTLLYVLSNKIGFLVSLASDSVKFFTKISKNSVVGTDVFWSIMCVLGTYYITYISASLIISYIRTKGDSEYYDYEDDEENGEPMPPAHRKKK